MRSTMDTGLRGLDVIFGDSAMAMGVVALEIKRTEGVVKDGSRKNGGALLCYNIRRHWTLPHKGGGAGLIAHLSTARGVRTAHPATVCLSPTERRPMVLSYRGRYQSCCVTLP